MIEASSLGLAESLTDEERAVELVYPRIERIRDISAQIALTVVRVAQKEVRLLSLQLPGQLRLTDIVQGVDRNVHLRQLDDTELLKYIKSKMWNPEHMSHL